MESPRGISRHTLLGLPQGIWGPDSEFLLLTSVQMVQVLQSRATRCSPSGCITERAELPTHPARALEVHNGVESTARDIDGFLPLSN